MIRLTLSKLVAALSKRRSVQGAVATLSIVGGAAHAAIPAEATAMFTQLGADAAAALALGWTLFAIVTGGFILFKIIKKAVNRAT